MKFLLKILSRLPGRKFQMKMSYIWAFGTVLLISLLCVILIAKFVLNKQERIKAALEAGQRIEVSLKTGELKGKISKSESQETTEKAAVTSDEKKEPEKTTENPPIEKAIESDKDSHKAWIKEDFIGPRLPDAIIEALFADDSSTSKIEVSSVSIKDLSDKPIVVIIIKGMGLSTSSTSDALELPNNITMGFSAYSPTLDEWVKKATTSGHESILNIPMETQDYHIDNPGPYSLLTQSSDEDNLTRLKMLLGLTKNYTAIYSENSEVFTRSEKSIKPVLEMLKKENKYFIYGGGYANYSMIQIADSINYPILVNDLVLDDDISTNAINDKFAEMEKIAHEKGYVVVMAHPYPITVRMIKSWLATTEEKGLVVKPVSILLGKVFK